MLNLNNIIMLRYWHKVSTAIIRADNREACLQLQTHPGRFLKIIFPKGKIIDKLSLIASTVPELHIQPRHNTPIYPRL